MVIFIVWIVRAVRLLLLEYAAGLAHRKRLAGLSKVGAAFCERGLVGRRFIFLRMTTAFFHLRGEKAICLHCKLLKENRHEDL
jgi:hypothetical protein